MPRHLRRRKRPWSLVIIAVVLLGVIGFSIVQVSDWIDASFSSNQTTAKKAKTAQPKTVNQVMLDVPLVNQMTTPVLYNGCEVTSLTMMLNYDHIDVTKNELASKLTSVPITYDSGEHGNPNQGFVGDVTGDNPGLGVYHGPIYKLAKTQTSQVQDLSGSNFDTVIKQLELGRPVWTITTVTFAPVDSLETWQTPQGSVKITYDMHSVVIVGFNRAKKQIYINNPYGEKQQAVNWKDFEDAYNQMGQQAVVLTLKH